MIDLRYMKRTDGFKDFSRSTYVERQGFLRKLQKHANYLTVDEYKRIKLTALTGNPEGAEKELGGIVERKIKSRMEAGI